jgi:uncharacterized membrane protein (UPF0136 family)
MGSELLKRCFYILVIFALLLGLAHLLWPEYRWGQGRRPYFNFNHSLTLASWFASVQFVGIAILALIGFHRQRHEPDSRSPQTWVWLLGALAALVLSVVEITRIHIRFALLNYPTPNIYEQFVIFPLGFMLLLLFGWFLLDKLRNTPDCYPYGVGWLLMWGLHLCLTLPSLSSYLTEKSWHLGLTLAQGLSYLIGGTMLLIALAGYCLSTKTAVVPTSTTTQKSRASFPEGVNPLWVLLGVAGTTFTMILLQIILFRMLTIFADYLTANSVISIALLGISVGGLIGFFTASSIPLSTMMRASLLFPVAILMAFGTTVSLTHTPFLASILLTLPFACGSTVITIALTRTQSHVVYFIDLLGAALGALLIGAALGYFREESSLLFLIAFAFLVACCFIIPHPTRRVRAGLIPLMLYSTRPSIKLFSSTLSTPLTALQ